MIRRFCALLAAALAIGSAAARADQVADFYKGKQVRVVVGYGPGGGYDVYARLLARHMGKYIPGNPTMVVVNMPGAASLVSANYLYSVAPKDGTVFGTFDRGTPLMAILGGNSNVSFDPTKLTWIGSSSSAADDSFLLYARKDAKVKTIEDLKRPNGPKLLVGVTAKGATDTEAAKLLRDVLKLNIQMFPGYPGASDIFLAIDRNEVDARLLGLSAVNSTKPEWLRPDSNMHVLLQIARTTRHPLFPDAPTARELAGDPKTLALVELAEMPHEIPRPFAGPPELPADRLKALQAAFMETAKDPAYQADAKKLDLDVTPMHGEELRKIVQKLGAIPVDVRDRLRDLQNEM
jgi:tripartite-type tricarboxylate transporter receptor subunit TctC